MANNAMVRVCTPSKTGGYLGIPPELRQVVQSTGDQLCARLPAGKIEVVSGKLEGTMIEDGIVEANQSVVIHLPAALSTSRYQVVVSYNPELVRHGVVSAPSVMQPKENNIMLGFKAHKKVNLNELVYVFALYMLD